MGSSIFSSNDAQSAAGGFLGALHDDEIATILGFTDVRRYAPHELAIRCGDVDRSLYIITAGRFEVLVPSPNGPQRASVFEPGDIFGDLAFFDGQPRSADVRALTEAETLIVTPAGLDRLRLAHPRLALVFALDLGRVLSIRFRGLNTRLAALGKL